MIANEIDHNFIDRAGRLLSACCAVHCLLMPLALALFPFWLGSLLRHETLHLSFVTTSIFVAGWAFWRGQRTHGRRKLMNFAVLAGALVLFGELFLESTPWLHAGISASAGLALAWGHQLNLRYCREHECACPSN
jgi:hypothetical protein